MGIICCSRRHCCHHHFANRCTCLSQLFQVALLCKQAGDIDRAKQALLHSKELEATEVETETEPEQSEPPKSSDTKPTIDTVSEPATTNG